MAQPAPVHAAKKTGPPPAIAFLFPCGGKVGTTFPCTVGGAMVQVQTQVWTDHPGIVFKPTAKPSVFDVTLAPDTPLGPHLVRFYTGQGAAPPHVFMVGAMNEIEEVEPNDDLQHPQKLPALPLTVNGRLGKPGDVDIFSCRVEAGHWLVLNLQGYALGTQMDPAMRLLDASGTEVLLSHDTYNLDPFIAFEVKKSGVYLIEVMAFIHPPAADATFKGGDEMVYRLTVTDQAYAGAAQPCALQRGVTGVYHPLGWNYGPSMMGPEQSLGQTTVIDGEERAHLPSTNGEVVLAAEVTTPVVAAGAPDDEATHAFRITPPCTVSACLKEPKAEGRFVFHAKRNAGYDFQVHAFALHSPIDAVLRIEDSSKKVLQQVDDNGEGIFDPVSSWHAPADGDYVAIVGDLYGRGGSLDVYALEMSPPQFRLRATLDASSYKIEAGKTTDLKLTLKASGSAKGKLKVTASGLPSGITFPATEIAAKSGDNTLTLTAASDVPLSNQPFEVTLSTLEPDEPQSWKAYFDLRGVEPRGDRLVNDDSRAWLTVTPKS